MVEVSNVLNTMQYHILKKLLEKNFERDLDICESVFLEISKVIN